MANLTDLKNGVRVEGSARKLTAKRLERECQLISGVFFDLPQEYELFLLKHNGGKPSPACFVFKNANREKVLNWVDRFFPVTSSNIDSLNLRGANQFIASLALHTGVPYDCITIGGAGGGSDHILLFVRGKKRGQVWLKVWDEVNDDPDPDRDTNPKEGLYRLAMSFDKFLQSLCSEEEAEKRIARREGKLT